MTVTFQGSLLGCCDEVGLEPLATGPLGSGVRRTALSCGAWVDIRRGWLTGADVLFDQLVDTVPWHGERRRMYDRTVDVPRLLSFYGEDQPLPDPALEDARLCLNAHYEKE